MGTERFSHYGLDVEQQIELVSQTYGLRIPARAFWRGCVQRLVGYQGKFVPAAIYNDLVVFHRPELNGGGAAHGLNIIRVLLALGIGRCDSLFEFCSGPGYIGYNLLANGF